MASHITFKAFPGQGIITGLGQLAKSMGAEFRELRADCCHPTDFQGLAYLNNEGGVSYAKYSPIHEMGLRPGQWAMIVITGGRDKERWEGTDVISILDNLDDENVTYVHIEYQKLP